MALTRTLAELRAGVRSKAHFEGTDEFVDDSYIDDLINEQLSEFFDWMTSLPGAEGFLQKRTTLTGSGPSLSLPSDFGQVQRLLFTDQNTRPVERINEQEEPYAQDLTGTLTYRLDYIPCAPQLSGDSDSVTLPFGSWERFVEYSVAARLLEEAEEDPGTALRRAESAKEAFMRNCTRLVRTQPKFLKKSRFAHRNQAYLVGTTQNHDTRYRLEGDTSSGPTIRFMRVDWSGGT